MVRQAHHERFNLMAERGGGETQNCDSTIAILPLNNLRNYTRVLAVYG
jgi:hypothetical protein